jgi:NAD(P)-dependent dehydrogenase (short-subunit alcohol dehydrogenase family)
MDLTKATVLVTGTNRGIGRQYVHGLLEAGVPRIHAGTRTPSAIDDLVKLGQGRVVPFTLDVRDAAAVEAAAAAHPDVSILINNAGYNANDGVVSARSLDEAEIEMSTNYFGMLRMCRAFAPVLAKNGGGIIVNMLSITAHACIPLMGSSSASKAAAWRMTQGVRAELAAQGTRVIGVFPGAVDTDMTRDYHGPKMQPPVVVDAVIAAIRGDTDDVFPGDMAQGIRAGLLADPGAVERELAQYLPPARPA